jgi:hypothetical protein
MADILLTPSAVIHKAKGVNMATNKKATSKTATIRFALNLARRLEADGYTGQGRMWRK